MKHIGEVILHDKKEDNCFRMGLRIRHENEATDEYDTVKRRRIGKYGRPVGTAKNNTLLDTRKYELKYDGDKTEYMNDNVIDDNLLDHVEE